MNISINAERIYLQPLLIDQSMIPIQTFDFHTPPAVNLDATSTSTKFLKSYTEFKKTRKEVLSLLSLKPAFMGKQIPGYSVPQMIEAF